MVINNRSIYISQLLANQSLNRHGFSSRIHGDMRESDKREEYLKLADISKPLFLVTQVHGSAIADPGNGPQRADAILTSDRNVSIGVLIADCVPLLFADKKGKYIGAVHAGWKGTALQISKKMVHRMNDLGVLSGDIQVAIGPHISLCCYTIQADRMAFFTEFADDPRAIAQFDDGWHMDIGKINALQLQDAGIKRENIDTSVFCTKCQSREFFSSRKDNGVLTGEMLAVISFA